MIKNWIKNLIVEAMIQKEKCPVMLIANRDPSESDDLPLNSNWTNRETKENYILCKKFCAWEKLG